MIVEADLAPVGHTIKPHGINGEISAVIDADIDPEDLDCIILTIDGIFVPFFINTLRSRGSDALLIKLDGINNELQAEKLAGLTIFVPASMLPDSMADDSGMYAADFVGWTLHDNDRLVGTIIGYDDSTENLIFSIETPDGRQLLIPVADDLIVDINPQTQTLVMDLPSGLDQL